MLQASSFLFHAAAVPEDLQDKERAARSWCALPQDTREQGAASLLHSAWTQEPVNPKSQPPHRSSLCYCL